MAKLPSSAIFRPEVQKLMTLVEESTRSTAEAVKYFVPPADGVLERAKSRRHHIIFGRRGSGKSSLLRKTYADHLVARNPAAIVDLEEFKGHSYPDVLVSILIKTLSEFEHWVKIAAVAPATKTSFWKKLTAKRADPPKLKKTLARDLEQRIGNEIKALERILHAPDEASIKEATSAQNKEVGSFSGAGNAKAGPVNIKADTSFEETTEKRRIVESEYKSIKIQALHRNIIKYKNLFKSIVEAAGGDAFLLLDDLYHIRSSDQAEVIDYFHRIAKGSGLWLKIGTIRHRTHWYTAGDPPIGIKLGDDADQIDLDITLETYQTTKAFLFRVLEQFSHDTHVKLGEILADGARDRLVLASGGVARDFLGLFRKAAAEAQERILRKELNRGDKIGAEDVNRAAGSYYDNKTEELKRDTEASDRNEIDNQIKLVRNFCLSKSEVNCFLVEKDIGPEIEKIMGELVDLKFIHHIRSRVTVRGRDRKVFDAYMLDLSFYTGERARRGLSIIELWKSVADGELRKANIIFREA